MTMIPRGTWAVDHAEFLASDQWQAIRLAAIERAGGKCQRCGKVPRVFNVHHLTYARAGGEERLGDLEALCRRCHLRAHNLSNTGRKKKPKAPRPAKVKVRRPSPREWSAQKRDAVAAAFARAPDYSPGPTQAERWKAARAAQRRLTSS